ncbi:MAG: bifunctional adenosylcobinamide kinase/adenosylcobinamide-phosphate guanylyltransferase [Hespellia sp.]|nr:bifunctional adenosylcobinamide kinase/adenosylcobinamide-phosphate guanylyltransferase [Hespellia sp.]
MILIIGGAYQGKKAYARDLFGGSFIDGAKCPLEELFSCRGIYYFHEYVKRWMESERTLEKGTELDEVLANQIIQQNPEVVIISNEIGCGIVPMDAGERRWRELVGRTMTHLAAFSGEVHRVVCGIGTVIKQKE